jgi:uncharacterized protein with GYD domain
MQTYVLMTKLGPEAGKMMKKRAKAGQAWMKQVKKACPKVKFIGHWAVLGDFDFISVYEAPDSDTAAKVSMISLANGASQAQSWTAIEYKRFVKLAEEI